ncbi:unnamed protein product [Didymodactylos carnosus]|uniref:protein-tyrosine-phosphatase n=1 Tax=Didymodactylos carnosus TaxID=1234261 RepID=A0A814FB19_9BILA|nr:unnamed protein product [Didymodactylos carnosus]CAF3752988.1 unnamed protein product [Didymodactylos carnosus]
MEVKDAFVQLMLVIVRWIKLKLKSFVHYIRKLFIIENRLISNRVVCNNHVQIINSKIPTTDEHAYIHRLELYRSSVYWNYRRTFTESLMEPSIVLDNFLFLGTIHQASNLKLLNLLDIRHILNVSDWKLNQFVLNKYNCTQIRILDSLDQDIRQHFDQTNQLLHSYFHKNEKVLVNCAAGISRSATIVLAYLMKYHHNTLEQAYRFLVDKRPIIGPNNYFMLQLIRYEKELIDTKEINFKNNNYEINPSKTVEKIKKT